MYLCRKKILKPLKQQRLIIGGEFNNLKWRQILPLILDPMQSGGWGSVRAARKVSPNWSGLGNCLSKLDETGVNL